MSPLIPLKQSKYAILIGLNVVGRQHCDKPAVTGVVAELARVQTVCKGV
jgi:hypothetical protein